MSAWPIRAESVSQSGTVVLLTPNFPQILVWKAHTLPECLNLPSLAFVEENIVLVQKILQRDIEQLSQGGRLARCRFKGFRACLYRAFCLCKGVGQEGPEAVDRQQCRCDLVSNAAAHHIQASGQVEQGLPV